MNNKIMPSLAICILLSGCGIFRGQVPSSFTRVNAQIPVQVNGQTQMVGLDYESGKDWDLVVNLDDKGEFRGVKLKTRTNAAALEAFVAQQQNNRALIELFMTVLGSSITRGATGGAIGENDNEVIIPGNVIVDRFQNDPEFRESMLAALDTK